MGIAGARERGSALLAIVANLTLRPIASAIGGAGAVVVLLAAVALA